MSSIYTVNKGVNRPIEFKGLRGQWIAWMAGGLVALLLFFAVGYLLGTPLYVLLPGVLAAGSGLLVTVFRLSKRYGEYGLMKKLSVKNQPRMIRLRSRRIFTSLKYDIKNNPSTYGTR